MRQTLSRGMVAAAAATSVLSLCGSPALADSQADGAAAHSPGVASGNAVQVPVEVPVNACGNTVNVVAALNPAFGNTCENESGDASHGGGGYGHDAQGGGGGYGHEETQAPTGASAQGVTANSPGVGSGNAAQVPVEVPVNACGNTVDVIALLNPAFGNACANEHTPPGYGDDTPEPPAPPEHKPPTPPEEEEPPPPAEEEKPPPPGHHEEHTPPPAESHEHPPALADTGSDGTTALGATAASAALILGGAVLYRRNRTAAQR
ncbi:chaplin [Streptomyces ziwulingensis]|uniref:Chaplin n=1 Tax=Streptomyces ziwulingensis TaxID=1045501 RepID=A0ABP9BY28_9ACTN